MPRGGEREGAPRAKYPNRSDMEQNPRTPGKTSQYGDKKRQAQVAATPDSGGFNGPPPGSLVPLDAPTERPNEPLTAGLDIGAGPGSEVLAARPVQDDALFDVRAMFAEYGRDYPELARIIAIAEDNV